MKSVAIVSTMPPSGITGNHTHTRLLYDGIRGSGYSCSLHTPFSGSRRWLPVFGVRPLVLQWLNRNWSVRWYRHWHARALRDHLLREFSRRPPYAVIAQQPCVARTALDVRERLGLNFLVTAVCHFNRGEAEEYREWWGLSDQRVYERFRDEEARTLQDVDQVVYVSHWAKREVEERRGIVPKSSQVIWNGIPEYNPPVILSRADVGLQADDLVLINVGTLEPRKNQVDLVRVFAEVASRHPRARLVLVGSGPDKGRITQAIDRERLWRKVILLGARSDVPALLNLSDIYVHYASIESFPFVLLEAARARLPSAAVPVGGVPEVQAELGGCISLPAHDPSAAAMALQPLVRSAELRSALGETAHRNLRKSLTQDAMVRKYLATIGLVSEADQSVHGGCPSQGSHRAEHCRRA